MTNTKFVNDIEEEAGECFRAGRQNHITDLVLIMGAITLSVAASILISIPAGPNWVTAAIAAVPALFGSLRAAVDFKGRAAWYFRKSARLRALALTLKYSSDATTEEAAAKRMGDILVEMEDKWSTFVSEKHSSESKAIE